MAWRTCARRRFLKARRVIGAGVDKAIVVSTAMTKSLPFLVKHETGDENHVEPAAGRRLGCEARQVSAGSHSQAHSTQLTVLTPIDLLGTMLSYPPTISPKLLKSSEGLEPEHPHHLRLGDGTIRYIDAFAAAERLSHKLICLDLGRWSG